MQILVLRKLYDWSNVIVLLLTASGMRNIAFFKTINQYSEIYNMVDAMCKLIKKQKTLCTYITFWACKLSNHIALQPPICKCHVQPCGNGSALSERPWKDQPKSKSAGRDIGAVMSGIHSQTVNPCSKYSPNVSGNGPASQRTAR